MKHCRLGKLNTTCFNRYMVECELFAKKQVSRRLRCFNRYMVECECAYSHGNRFYAGVLIDTWWNVNRIEFVQKLVCDAF